MDCSPVLSAIALFWLVWCHAPAGGTAAAAPADTPACIGRGSVRGAADRQPACSLAGRRYQLTPAALLRHHGNAHQLVSMETVRRMRHDVSRLQQRAHRRHRREVEPGDALDSPPAVLESADGRHGDPECCQATTELTVPLTATSVVTNGRVQVAQSPPDLVQPLLVTACPAARCPVTNATCTQLHAPQMVVKWTGRRLVLDLVYVESGCACTSSVSSAAELPSASRLKQSLNGQDSPNEEEVFNDTISFASQRYDKGNEARVLADEPRGVSRTTPSEAMYANHDASLNRNIPDTDESKLGGTALTKRNRSVNRKTQKQRSLTVIPDSLQTTASKASEAYTAKPETSVWYKNPPLALHSQVQLDEIFHEEYKDGDDGDVEDISHTEDGRDEQLGNTTEDSMRGQETLAYSNEIPKTVLVTPAELQSDATVGAFLNDVAIATDHTSTQEASDSRGNRFKSRAYFDEVLKDISNKLGVLEASTVATVAVSESSPSVSYFNRDVHNFLEDTDVTLDAHGVSVAAVAYVPEDSIPGNNINALKDEETDQTKYPLINDFTDDSVPTLKVAGVTELSGSSAMEIVEQGAISSLTKMTTVKYEIIPHEPPRATHQLQDPSLEHLDELDKDKRASISPQLPQLPRTYNPDDASNDRKNVLGSDITPEPLYVRTPDFQTYVADSLLRGTSISFRQNDDRTLKYDGGFQATHGVSEHPPNSAESTEDTGASMFGHVSIARSPSPAGGAPHETQPTGELPTVAATAPTEIMISSTRSDIGDALPEANRVTPASSTPMNSDSAGVHSVSELLLRSQTLGQQGAHVHDLGEALSFVSQTIDAVRRQEARALARPLGSDHWQLARIVAASYALGSEMCTWLVPGTTTTTTTPATSTTMEPAAGRSPLKTAVNLILETMERERKAMQKMYDRRMEALDKQISERQDAIRSTFEREIELLRGIIHSLGLTQINGSNTVLPTEENTRRCDDDSQLPCEPEDPSPTSTTPSIPTNNLRNSQRILPDGCQLVEEENTGEEIIKQLDEFTSYLFDVGVEFYDAFRPKQSRSAKRSRVLKPRAAPTPEMRLQRLLRQIAGSVGRFSFALDDVEQQLDALEQIPSLLSIGAGVAPQPEPVTSLNGLPEAVAGLLRCFVKDLDGFILVGMLSDNFNSTAIEPMAELSNPTTGDVTLALTIRLTEVYASIWNVWRVLFNSHLRPATAVELRVQENVRALRLDRPQLRQHLEMAVSGLTPLERDQLAAAQAALAAAAPQLQFAVSELQELARLLVSAAEILLTSQARAGQVGPPAVIRQSAAAVLDGLACFSAALEDPDAARDEFDAFLITKKPRPTTVSATEPVVTSAPTEPTTTSTSSTLLVSLTTFSTPTGHSSTSVHVSSSESSSQDDTTIPRTTDGMTDTVQDTRTTSNTDGPAVSTATTGSTTEITVISVDEETFPSQPTTMTEPTTELTVIAVDEETFHSQSYTSSEATTERSIEMTAIFADETFPSQSTTSSETIPGPFQQTTELEFITLGPVIPEVTTTKTPPTKHEYITFGAPFPTVIFGRPFLSEEDAALMDDILSIL